MTNQQIIQLVVFGLLMGASGISWILRKVGEQAQKRAALQELERRRQEALRTGRDPNEIRAEDVARTPAPAPQPADDAGAIAERRRLHLEELRRRQMSRAQGGGVQIPQGPAMPRTIPGSTGTTVPTQGRSRGERRTPPQRPRADRGQLQTQGAAAAEAARRDAIRRQQQNARQRAQQENQAEAQRLSAQRADEAGVSTTSRLVKDVQDGAYATDPNKRALAGGGQIKRARVLGQEMTARDWRRAFIVNEILSEPVSMRDV